MCVYFNVVDQLLLEHFRETVWTQNWQSAYHWLGGTGTLTVTWERVFGWTCFIYIYTHTHSLPYTMEQSASWRAKRFEASQKFHALYGPLSFITAFTSVRNLSLSWTTTIQSFLPHSTYWISTLILSSQLRLSIPSDLLPQVSLTKPCMRLSPPHTRYMPHRSHS